MPSSRYEHISIMMDEIIKTNPKTILDIGIGFGKWGYLAREFLETYNDRVYPASWLLKIDGVEIWQKYIKEFSWLKKIYNHIYIADICSIVDNLPEYELIIAGDVIEHIEKSKGLEILKKLIEKATKRLILSIPLGDWLNNRIVGNNKYESHKAIWSFEELLNLSPIRKYTLAGIGVFVYAK